MKDKYSVERVAELHPLVRQKFTDFINECETTLGVTFRISMGYRSIDEQNKIYAQGRTTPGNIVTNAKGGTSFHNYGLAIDLVEMSEDEKTANWNFDMSKLSPIAKKYGLEWGGSWTHIVDRPHFEYRAGFKENCSDALLFVQQGKVDKDGYVIIPNAAV